MDIIIRHFYINSHLNIYYITQRLESHMRQKKTHTSCITQIGTYKYDS